MVRSTSLIRLSGMVLVLSVIVGWAARMVTAQLGLGVLQTVALLVAAGMMLVAQWLRHTDPARASHAGRRAPRGQSAAEDDSLSQQGQPRSDDDEAPEDPGSRSENDALSEHGQSHSEIDEVPEAGEPRVWEVPLDEPTDGNEIHHHSSSSTR